MIQIAVAAFFVWCFFKFIDKEGYLDGFTSLAFILAPALIIFFATVLVRASGLPIWVLYLFETSYFLVPLLMLKSMTEFTWPKIIGYSAAVFTINLVCQVAGFVFIATASA
ncbi:hypothetical protein [Aliiglaciecola sp. LCG003]|uniref:hypothetical protein n=1 Tax=Aliiglaciecola sp. LCG003 TaxID=3053655 RepID=UPI0025737466|nr:hypothetical protein [Aliiglaciecola sp. LCG003]WJG08595.1 hypothetical protein QR722_14795 [Aliiglaciecola sp. LCG003]